MNYYKMKLRFAVMTICGFVIAAAAEPQAEKCSSWNDIDINIAFPPEIAGLRMESRTVFDEDNYSLLYVSPEWQVSDPRRRMLTIYVYSRGEDEPLSNGVSDRVRKELSDAVGSVRLRAKEHDLRDFSLKAEAQVRTWSRSGLSYLLSVMSYKTRKERYPLMGCALVSAYAGRYVKIRYTSGVDANVERPTPHRWGEVVTAFDDLIVDGRTARNRDIYKISETSSALTAVREKWRGAAERVSMWKMPQYSEKFLEIDEFQDWCNDDPKRRYSYFEKACDAAIKMRIEPAVWYYNLACCKSVLGQKDAAIVALEKAIAAGYDKAETAKKDSDLDAVVNDERFQKLCEIMEGNSGWASPRKPVVENNGVARLTGDSVYFAFNDASYWVDLVTSNRCPIVYVNHHENHPDVPCDGLIQAIYPEEAKEEGVHVGPANIHFLDVLRSKALGCESWCPTIVASDWMKELDPMNGPSSIPARMPVVRGCAHQELKHKLWNVLSVYAAGVDYAHDGIDRFMGHYTGCVVHTGDASESDKFVKLIAEAIREMPEKFRTQAAFIIPNIIRHGQKCVKTEADFMTGAAHRPAIGFRDVDAKKVVAMAMSLSEEAPLPLTPYFDQEHCGFSLDETPVGDLWDAPYDRPLAAMSAHHICNMARAANKTWTLQVAVFKPKRGKLVWKVLQGDPEKVRMKEQTGPENVLLEVDHHEAFDVTLSDGKSVKSSRVDIGCFLVDGGVASVPAIVSVYFMPNETRTFRPDGKLESIDYTRRQYKEFCPRLCPKGDWKDCFHWNDQGELTGWTRFHTDEQGRITTNEFTREGLVIDSRDPQGRPKDVHRSLRSTWMQELEPTNTTGQVAEHGLAWLGHVYDRDDRHPNETTLAWRYVYTNSTDVFGRPQPKEPKPFSCRPELCRRADFFDEKSGFRLPLLDQMSLGYNIYAGYKHDVIGVDVADNLREDSELVLKEQGLTPPKHLKMMRFCPWHSSSNDIWKVDMDDLEPFVASQLAELSEGVYRIRKDRKDVDAGDGYEYQSVRASYLSINTMCVNAAYAKLDATYRRCKAAEVKKRLADMADDNDWAAIHICEGKLVSREEVPDGINYAMAGWEIKDGLFFGIQSDLSGAMGRCKYFFRKCDVKTGVPQTLDSFNELPSRAIGNTIVNADADDPAAVNNFAVLFYAGIANPDKYEEESVTILLERAARAGCATAKYNLGVMSENRGEKNLAARYYDEARVLGADAQRRDK